MSQNQTISEGVDEMLAKIDALQLELGIPLRGEVLDKDEGAPSPTFEEEKDPFLTRIDGDIAESVRILGRVASDDLPKENLDLLTLAGWVATAHTDIHSIGPRFAVGRMARPMPKIKLPIPFGYMVEQAEQRQATVHSFLLDGECLLPSLDQVTSVDIEDGQTRAEKARQVIEDEEVKQKQAKLKEALEHHGLLARGKANARLSELVKNKEPVTMLLSVGPNSMFGGRAMVAEAQMAAVEDELARLGLWQPKKSTPVTITYNKVDYTWDCAGRGMYDHKKVAIIHRTLVNNNPDGLEVNPDNELVSGVTHEYFAVRIGATEKDLTSSSFNLMAKTAKIMLEFLKTGKQPEKPPLVKPYKKPAEQPDNKVYVVMNGNPIERLGKVISKCISFWNI